jgi:hypothetical protein
MIAAALCLKQRGHGCDIAIGVVLSRSCLAFQFPAAALPVATIEVGLLRVAAVLAPSDGAVLDVGADADVASWQEALAARDVRLRAKHAT